MLPLKISVLALAVCMTQQLPASDLSVKPTVPPQNVAFARYVASVPKREILTESTPSLVLIQESVAGLYKESAVLALKRSGKDGSEYAIAGIDGDSTVGEEVTARYIKFQEQIEALPRSSVAIIPENYKFHFRGEVSMGEGSAYVYDVTPKKRRPGLFKGQIWIEAETGAELLVSGRFTDPASRGESINFVRETKFDTPGFPRITHLSLNIPILGRSDLVIIELPVPSNFDLRIPQVSSDER